MKCKYCGVRALVINCRFCESKRTGQIYIKRRHECLDGHRFTTYERRNKSE